MKEICWAHGKLTFRNLECTFQILEHTFRDLEHTFHTLEYKQLRKGFENEEGERINVLPLAIICVSHCLFLGLLAFLSSAECIADFLGTEHHFCIAATELAIAVGSEVEMVEVALASEGWNDV